MNVNEVAELLQLLKKAQNYHPRFETREHRRTAGRSIYCRLYYLVEQLIIEQPLKGVNIDGFLTLYRMIYRLLYTDDKFAYDAIVRIIQVLSAGCYNELVM